MSVVLHMIQTRYSLKSRTLLHKTFGIILLSKKLFKEKHIIQLLYAILIQIYLHIYLQ